MLKPVLKRLLPQSLFGRLALAILVLLLVAQGAVFFISQQGRMAARSAQGAQFAVGHVRALHTALQARQAEWTAAGIRSVQTVGDAFAPGTVAAAVYAGHRAARELDAPEPELDAVPFRREMIAVSPLLAP